MNITGFILCVSLILLVEADPPISRKAVIVQKTLHSAYFDDLTAENKNAQNVTGGAVVLKSNMPVGIQLELVTKLNAIYQSSTDQLQRAQRFQIELGRVYNEYWEVVINFDVITFYSQYYIYMQINNDRVLGFGLT